MEAAAPAADAHRRSSAADDSHGAASAATRRSGRTAGTSVAVRAVGAPGAVESVLPALEFRWRVGVGFGVGFQPR